MIAPMFVAVSLVVRASAQYPGAEEGIIVAGPPHSMNDEIFEALEGPGALYAAAEAAGRPPRADGENEVEYGRWPLSASRNPAQNMEWETRRRQQEFYAPPDPYLRRLLKISHNFRATGLGEIIAEHRRRRLAAFQDTDLASAAGTGGGAMGTETGKGLGLGMGMEMGIGMGSSRMRRGLSGYDVGGVAGAAGSAGTGAGAATMDPEKVSALLAALSQGLQTIASGAEGFGTTTTPAPKDNAIKGFLALIEGISHFNNLGQQLLASQRPEPVL